MSPKPSPMSAKRQALLDHQLAEAEARAETAPLRQELVEYDLEDKRQRAANISRVAKRRATIARSQGCLKHLAVGVAVLATLMVFSLFACLALSAFVLAIILPH